MYTCPDSSLYSAYIDGEIPSPWKEKLEDHIGSCKKCTVKMAQYSKISSLIKETSPVLTQQALESSYEKLLHKRAQRKLEGELSFSHKIQTFKKSSIKISLPAFAAILIAAVVFPSLYVANTHQFVQTASANAEKTALSSMSRLQTPSQDFKQLTSKDVYSADPLPTNISGTLRVSSSDQLFSMLEYAKKFATDDELFSSGDVIIIKLPEISRFDTPSINTQSMASYYK